MAALFDDISTALDTLTGAVGKLASNPLVKATGSVNALPEEALQVFAEALGGLDAVVRDHVAKAQAAAVADAQGPPPDPDQPA
jgi:hypothetical protein